MELTLLTGVGLVLLGLIASTYGVLVGSGGGFIVSPLLILLFKMDHNVAVGTSLMAVFIASVSGAVSYLRLGRVDKRSALLFGGAAIPGVLLGVLGVKEVAGPTFQIAFGVLLAIVGLSMFVRPNPSAERDAPTLVGEADVLQLQVEQVPKRRAGIVTRDIVTADRRRYHYSFFEPAAVGVNVVFGFVSGFFGIGGGPLRSPTLVYVFRFPVLVAAATSVVTQSIYTGVGSIGHIAGGNIDWIPVALLGAGVVVGAQAGVRLSVVVRGVGILRLLSLALVIIGTQLILNA